MIPKNWTEGWLLLLTLSLLGCGEDPILTKAREDQKKAATTEASPTTVKPGTPTPPAGSGVAKAGVPEQPKPGIPVEPAPGRPDEPPPAAAGAPQSITPGSPIPGTPTSPAPGKPTEQTGPKVKIGGTIRFPDWKGGQVRVSAFDGPHAEHAGTQPKIIGEVKLDKPGDFQMEVPESAGSVYIEAAVDEDGDGRPGPLDPQGSADPYPVMVETSAVSGLVVSLSRREPPPGAPRKDDF